MCYHYYGGVNICDMRLCVLRPGGCLRIANTVVPKSRPTKRAFILHIGPQSVRRNFAQRANLEFRDGSPMLFCSLALKRRSIQKVFFQVDEKLGTFERAHPKMLSHATPSCCYKTILYYETRNVI